MAEFEKFKRRVIRSVARKTFVEKKTEEELWSELKAETKCDCKLLWERMRALTLKKLRRLLLADDKLESIIPIAQMSLTDWLLFDLVLVHEDIDVIGRDILDPKADLGPLQELVDLINEFNIEGKQGEALVAAWTLVTYNYNNRGRQCSPMLLQRRWFQMKQHIRNHFYMFWYKYRGSTKLLDKVKDHIPSKFEMNVAKRYPYIVTRKFLEWEKLIEQKLVILPQEFENKFRSQCGPKSAEKNDNEPDLVLLERNIETIELADADSDAENVEENSEKPTTDTTTDPKSVVVKTEPQDDVEPTEPTKPITVEQLAEELSKRDTQLLETISNIEEDVDGSRNGDDVVESIDKENEDNDVTTEENAIVNTSDAISNNVEDVEPMLPQITNVFGKVETEVLAKISKAFLSGDEKTALNVPIQDNTTVVEPMDVLAKIRRAFLSGDDKTALKVPIQDNSTAVEPMEVNDSEVDEKLKSFLDDQLKSNETRKLNNESTTTSAEKTEKENAQKIFSPSDVENARVTNPFLGVPIDLTFTDDGVELVDDGIEYDEDEEDIIKTFYEEDAGVNDNSSSPFDKKAFEEQKVQAVEASDNKFDLKLLMLPIVYTTRIDDMAVLKNINVSNINDKQVIEKVFIESKPVMKQDTGVKIKKEKLENKDSSLAIGDDNCESSAESASESEEISEDTKVKLSSYLLQKPRSRSYNPIQLCKNPDFNTRLKRLTVGFLSSTRNRAMLKTLKPITIDISKAFENKLVDGTLYLKSNDSTTAAPQNAEENQQVSTVLPSAMSVQSLIDQTPPQQMYVGNSKEKNMLGSQNEPDDEHVIKRNKNINLPDYEKIRKMNQRLYTVEVAPMRVQGSIERCAPPVKIVNKEQDTITPKATKTSDKNNHLTSTSDQRAKQLMKKLQSYQMQIKRNVVKTNERSTCSWLVAKSVNTQNELAFDDALITIDTLNKMLNIINDDKGKSIDILRKTKSKKKASYKDQVELKQREKIIDNVLNNRLDENELKGKNVSSDPQPQANEQKELRKEEISETKKSEHKENNDLKKIDVQKELRKPKDTSTKDIRTVVKKPKVVVVQGKRYNSDVYCCWAREKILNPSGKRRHSCPRICECCCRGELAAKLKKVYPKPKFITISDDEDTPQNQPKQSPIKSADENVPVRALISIQWKEPKNILNESNSDQNNVIEIDDLEQDSTSSNQIPEVQLNISTVEVPSNDISIKWKDPENIDTKSNSDQNNIIAIDDSEQDSASSNKIPEVQLNISTMEVPSNDISIKWKHPENIVTKSNSDQNNIIAIDDLEQDSTSSKQMPEVQLSANTMEIPASNMPRINILSPAALGAPSNKTVRRNNELLIPIAPLPTKRRRIKIINPEKVDCQPITFTTQQSDQTLKKLLYLNSNHLKSGQGAPIYLGPNKVLLTDGAIPPHHGNSNVLNVRSQAKMSVYLPDLAIPEGVRVVILPNGNLSFVIDDNVNLDSEKLSQLPVILNTVRQYLMTTMASNDVGGLNKPIPEVINLIDDERLENNDKRDNDLTNLESSIDNSNTPCTENNETIICETVPIDEETVILPNCQINPSAEESAKQTVPTPSEVIESNLDIEGQNAKEVENTSECINGSNALINPSIAQNILADTEPRNSETAENINEGDLVLKDKDDTNVTDSHTNSNMSRKTLLSDLMEMSGISMEDVIPTANENLVQESLPTASVVATTAEVAPKTTDNCLQTSANSVPIVKNNMLAQLSAVYTFSQLKYACETNSKFFTLDLKTGVISVINVFIKNKSKIQIHKNEKLFIDLTDDQDGAVENLNLNSSRSLLKTNINNVIEKAQPLKLFKSVGILNRKQKRRVEENATEAAIRAKRSRKQLLAANEVLECSDSSDDEPLSTISKRIRMEEVAQRLVADTVPSEMDTTVSNDLDQNVQEEETEEATEHLSPGDKEDADMEADISFLCGEASDNEDCILGF